QLRIALERALHAALAMWRGHQRPGAVIEADQVWQSGRVDGHLVERIAPLPEPRLIERQVLAGQPRVHTPAADCCQERHRSDPPGPRLPSPAGCRALRPATSYGSRPARESGKVYSNGVTPCGSFSTPSHSCSASTPMSANCSRAPWTSART